MGGVPYRLVCLFSLRLVAVQWHSDIPRLLGLKSVFRCHKNWGIADAILLRRTWQILAAFNVRKKLNLFS